MNVDITITKGSRVPANLQAVFIAASLGKEIEQPPPQKASSGFYLDWIWNGNKDTLACDDTSVSKSSRSSFKSKSSTSRSGDKKGLFGNRRPSSSKESKRRKSRQTFGAPVPLKVSMFCLFHGHGAKEVVRCTHHQTLAQTRLPHQSTFRLKRTLRAFFEIADTRQRSSWL